MNRGAGIDFMVSVNPPQPFTVEVFRVGAEDVSVLKTEALDGVAQEWSALDLATRTITCSWAPTWHRGSCWLGRNHS